MKKSIGLSIAALAAGAVLSIAATEVAAAPLLSLTVQPIQLCNNDGSDCANPTLELYAAEANKIWAQADIVINFLPWQTVNSTLLNQTDAGDSFGGYASSGNAKILNIYFANYMQDCGGTFPTGLYGCGTVGGTGGRIVINDLVFSYDNPANGAGVDGRIDTIAHEIGHTLGLGHGDFGAGGANNLLTTGASRTIPLTLAEIFPDGADLSQLTQDQIDEARSSDRLEVVPVPEPVPVALIGLGLLVMTLRRRTHS